MLAQQLVNGLFLGSIYALFALGYTLVFGVLDILNLAHAAVFMLACFVALALVASLPPATSGRPAAGRGRSPACSASCSSGSRSARCAGAVRLQHLRPHQLARHGDRLRGHGRFRSGARTSPASRRHLSRPADPGPRRRSCPSSSSASSPSRWCSFLALTCWSSARGSAASARGGREPARRPHPGRRRRPRHRRRASFISSALGGAAGVLFGLAFNSISPDMGAASS